MQIILMEKVVNLGDLGDLVKVKDGYARNFLIPHGKAKRATPADDEGIRRPACRTGEGRCRQAGWRPRRLPTKLEGVLVTVARKAGVDGRLFGSVTNHDVADGLKALGFDVEKSDIRMPMGPLKTIGESSLEIALHTDVLASIKVAVVGEQ